MTDTPETHTGEVETRAQQQALATAQKSLRLGGSEDFSLTVFGSTDSFALAQRMGTLLAHSSLVPDVYQVQYLKGDEWINNPCAIGNCVIAVEIATRLRMSPIMVMQNLDVIHGRPSFRGSFLAGLVNQSTKFDGDLEYEWTGEPGKPDWGCRAYAVNARTGKTVYGAWITWKMVVGEGWNSKRGSKWLTMPEQMFMYRAATFFSRVHAPDLLLGMQTTEELEDTNVPLLTDRRAGVVALNERLGSPPPDLGEAGEEGAGNSEREPEREEQAEPETKPTRTRKKREPLPQADAEPKGAPEKAPPEEVSGIAPIELEKPEDDPEPDSATAARVNHSFDVE